MGSITQTSGALKQNIYQTAVAIGAGSLSSVAFSAQTYAIRLSATAACFYQIGEAVGVTATANSAYLPTNWVEVVAVNPGQKVATIQSVGAGSLSIVELTT